MSFLALPSVASSCTALLLALCAHPLLSRPLQAQDAPVPRVGPSRGAVMVVGGGAQGPELYAKFIELAGGPDALIIDVPTAGGDSTYPTNWRGTRGLIAAGARNVRVLHTIDRKLADSDSFAAPLARAGGVWFEGGRQWHLVDSYAGTRTERAFHDVLARGGVVGGSSAGASILSSYMLRGARAGNETIMAPGYEMGFGFLRGVAIDQHVVARERLRDLADSLMPRHPELLGISEDEGTAWVVRGDTAEIIGRNKAFVYGGRDATDPGAPFLTLWPGDRYDLAVRRVTHRAANESPLTRAFADSVFTAFGHAGQPMATVLVARGGKVLLNTSYGVPPHAKYMPTTTVPNFPLAGLSASWNAIAAQLVARDGHLSLDEPMEGGNSTRVRELLTRGTMTAAEGSQLVELLTKRGGVPYAQLVERRLFTPIGAHRTRTTPSGDLESNVDELYRWSLGLDAPQGFARDSVSPVTASAPVLLDTTLGWRAERFHGLQRLAAYGAPDGSRNAFVRYPDERAVVIVLTSDGRADARMLADRLAERLLVSTQPPR